MTTDGLWENFTSGVDFLTESESSDQAHKLGLKYAGRGYWKDAQGKTVAKTQAGKLIKLDGGEMEAPAEEPSIEEPTPTQPELPDDHFHKLAGAMYSQKPEGPKENTFDMGQAIQDIAGDDDVSGIGDMQNLRGWTDKEAKFFEKQLNRIKNAKTNVDVFNAGTALKKANLLDKEGWKALLKYTKQTRPDLEKYVPPSKATAPMSAEDKAYAEKIASQVIDKEGGWVNAIDYAEKSLAKSKILTYPAPDLVKMWTNVLTVLKQSMPEPTQKPAPQIKTFKDFGTSWHDLPEEIQSEIINIADAANIELSHFTGTAQNVLLNAIASAIRPSNNLEQVEDDLEYIQKHFSGDLSSNQFVELEAAVKQVWGSTPGKNFSTKAEEPQEKSLHDYLEASFNPLPDEMYSNAADLFLIKDNLIGAWLEVHDKFMNSATDKDKKYFAGVLNALAAKGARSILDIEDNNVDNALVGVNAQLTNSAITPEQEDWFSSIKKVLDWANEKNIPKPHPLPKETPDAYVDDMLKNISLDDALEQASEKFSQVTPGTPEEKYWKGVLQKLYTISYDEKKYGKSDTTAIPTGKPADKAKELKTAYGEFAQEFAWEKMVDALPNSVEKQYWQSVVSNLKGRIPTAPEPGTKTKLSQNAEVWLSAFGTKEKAVAAVEKEIEDAESNNDAESVEYLQKVHAALTAPEKGDEKFHTTYDSLMKNQLKNWNIPIGTLSLYLGAFQGLHNNDPVAFSSAIDNISKKLAFTPQEKHELEDNLKNTWNVIQASVPKPIDIPASAVKAANTLMSKIHNLDAAKAWAQKKINAAPDEKTKVHFGHIVAALDAYHSGAPAEEPPLTPAPDETPKPLAWNPPDVDANAIPLTKIQQTAEKIKEKFGTAGNPKKLAKAIAWVEKKKALAKFAKKKAQYDELIAILKGETSKTPPSTFDQTKQKLMQQLAQSTIDGKPIVTAEQPPKVLSFADINKKYAQPTAPKFYDKYFNQAMNAKSLAELDHALSQLNGVGNLSDIDIKNMRKDLLALRPDLLPPDTSKMDLQKEMEANVVHTFFQKFPMTNKTPEEKKAIGDMLVKACNQANYQEMKKVLLDMKEKGMISDVEVNAMKDISSGIPSFHNKKEEKLQKIEWEKANAEKIAAEKKAMEKKLASLTPEKKKQFNDIFSDLEASGAIKTLPQSNQTTIKNAIIGSMLANDVDDVMDKLMPLTGAGLNTKDVMAIRGKVLNAFLDIPPYQPKSEPKTVTPTQERSKQVLNKWVDSAGFGIANVPSNEQQAIRDAVNVALTVAPDKVDDAITSLNFNTSILTPQIEMIRDFVKQERQNPGVFKNVTKIAAGEPPIKKLPSANAPFGMTPTGKAKKPPKPIDRIGKKMVALDVPADKQAEVRTIVANIIKKYKGQTNPYGVANETNSALYAVKDLPYSARRKMALFVKSEFKKGLAAAYDDKGMLDKAAAIKAAQAALTTGGNIPANIAGGHFLANKTLVQGEKVDYNPTAHNANYHKQNTKPTVTLADKKAAEDQANYFIKTLPPKLYEKFHEAVRVIKSSSWWSKSSITRKATNEALTKVANGPPPAVTTVKNWVERGMHIPNQDIEDFMKAFKIGETAYLGPSEFTLDGDTSNQYSGHGKSDSDSTSVLMRVRPPHTGKLNAIHVHKGKHSSHPDEYGVFLGMSKNLLVTEVIKHVFNGGKSIAYEIVMMQDDPALLEARLREASDSSAKDKFGLMTHLWDEAGVSKRTQAILIKYMNGPMGNPDTKSTEPPSQPEQPMNKESLNNLIRTELKKIMGESTINMNPRSDDQTFSNTDTSLSPGSKLMQTPGAPYGGNAAAFSQVPMNNESRAALKDWLRFAKACWNKFGVPSNWPKQHVQKAVELGQAFENYNRPQQTSIGYRP